MSQCYLSLQMIVGKQNTGDSVCLFDFCFITRFPHLYSFPVLQGMMEHRLILRTAAKQSQGSLPILLRPWFWKAVWGLLIILSVSSSWVGTTQIVKITYKNFYCPFFMTWFSTNWNIMFFSLLFWSSGHCSRKTNTQWKIQVGFMPSQMAIGDGLR